MAKETAGEAIISEELKKSARHQRFRGPLDFVADVIYCGGSVYVGCVQLSGANVTVADSVLHFATGGIHEHVYNAKMGSTAVFSNVVIKGKGRTGHASKNSTVHITGGDWSSVTSAAHS